MDEALIRKYMKLNGDLKSYCRYKEYTDKLYSIKNKIFNQVLSRLSSFSCKSFNSDCYFSPSDLSIELTSEEVVFLTRYKNEKI